MKLPSDSKQTRPNSGRGHVWHLMCGLPPTLVLPLRLLPTGRSLKEEERLLYSILRKKHDRHGWLLKIAELNRKDFWNLAWIQKSSLCWAADSRFLKMNLLLSFSSCIYSCIFIPQCVSKRVWCTFPFLQRENGNLKKSQASVRPGKAVGSSAEEIWSCDFRVLQVTVRNSRELQADKQIIFFKKILKEILNIGIPRFILLDFIVLCKYCRFYKLKIASLMAMLTWWLTCVLGINCF